jgi:hypothetical protein
MNGIFPELDRIEWIIVICSVAGLLVRMLYLHYFARRAAFPSRPTVMFLCWRKRLKAAGTSRVTTTISQRNPSSAVSDSGLVIVANCTLRGKPGFFSLPASRSGSALL